MTDQLSTEDLELEYPQVILPPPLSLFLDCVNASENTTGRITASDRAIAHPSMPPASLSDSWTSLPEADSSYEDDLQSEHTDVGSLLDVRSADDVQSVTDADVEEDDSQGHESEEELPGIPSVFESSQFRDPVDFTPRGTGLNDLNTSFLGSRSESGYADNAAPPAKTLPGCTVRHLNIREQTLLQEQVEGDATAELSSTIRMTLLSHGLDLNSLDYFKVILLGRTIEQFRPEIQRKLGDALVSSGSASTYSTGSGSVSRFHLVPNTFGPGSEPDFADLVAIDKQIEFEYYDRAEEATPETSKAHSPLRLKNSETGSEISSLWNLHEFVISRPRWIPPDVAIICVETDSLGNTDTTSASMLRFVKRHEIPWIAIRLDRDWYGRYQGCLRQGALHESIEAFTPEVGDTQVMGKYPIDMASFLNLDPTDLNKHIAWALEAPNQVVDKQHVVCDDVKSKELRHTWRQRLQLYPIYGVLIALVCTLVFNLAIGTFSELAPSVSASERPKLSLVAVDQTNSTKLATIQNVQITTQEAASVITTTSLPADTLAVPVPQDESDQVLPLMAVVQANLGVIRSQLESHIISVNRQMETAALKAHNSLMALELEKVAKDQLGIAQRRARRLVTRLSSRANKVWA